MNKYDLPDIGIKYKGVASVPTRTIEWCGLNIIDVPVDVPDQEAISFVKNFINNIVALEVPTSLVCNLRCVYCYIDDPRMKNKYVTRDQVFKILDNASEMFPGLSKDENIRKSISRSRKDAKVYLSPWGAEPFMNIPTLEMMYEFAHEYYGKNNYELSTSTNGTIWNKRVEQFFTNLYNDGAFKDIQISLDGPKWLQDKARPHANGQGSYDKIEEFSIYLKKLMKSLGYDKKPLHYCSTIHLVDDNFVSNWIAAAEFFSTPNEWFTSLPVLPMRMSGEDMQNEDHVQKFVEAQRLMADLVKKRAKQGITVCDFYTFKLFGNISAHSINAFPYCSALNTQIGIDIDGSIYPCHGPVTTPSYKPFLWFGNVFEKVISYRQLFRNFSYQYGTLWTRGKCTTCPLFNFASGNLCWSCPAHNLAITGEPSIDSAVRCVAYNESFKYWVEIAKITLDNPILKDIPYDWYNDSTLNMKEFKNKKIKVLRDKMHFDMEYDAMMANAISRFDIMERRDAGKFGMVDSWWTFDDFIDEVNGKKKINIKQEVKKYVSMLKEELQKKEKSND